MTREELIRANNINKEIDKLENFIYKATSVWTGKIVANNYIETKRLGKFIFKSNSYGVVEGAELELDTEMKNEVLQVLKDKVTKLYKELSEI
jgi:hypothetical protein